MVVGMSGELLNKQEFHAYRWMIGFESVCGFINNNNYTFLFCHEVNLSGVEILFARQLPSHSLDDGGSCKNHSCGVYILSVGLL